MSPALLFNVQGCWWLTAKRSRFAEVVGAALALCLIFMPCHVQHNARHRERPALWPAWVYPGHQFVDVLVAGLQLWNAEAMKNTNKGSRAACACQRHVQRILEAYPTSAESAQSNLLCCQPGSVSGPLTAQVSMCSQRHRCRLSARPGASIFMLCNAYHGLLHSKTESDRCPRETSWVFADLKKWPFSHPSSPRF